MGPAQQLHAYSVINVGSYCVFAPINVFIVEIKFENKSNNYKL
jgi:hypothetical protein